MSYTFDESLWTGGYYLVDGEGTEQTPIDFHDVFDNLIGLKTGLFQIPQNYGAGTSADPYELCENNASEWSVSGDVGSPANEAGTVKYNSYSIKVTKTGSGTFSLMWNQNRSYQNWLSASVDSFNISAARVMKFSIYPSVNMTLDVIGILAGAAGATYQNDHTNDGNGWVLIGGQWNDFEIDISEFDTPGTRFYGGLIHQIDFDFSGGTTSDTLIIDGLHFYRDDCDIKKIGASTYEFCFDIQFDDCYFSHDSEVTVIFNAGAPRYGGGYHIIEFEPCYQVDIGSDSDKYGVILISDCVSSDVIFFLANCTDCDINIRNTRFIIKHWQWEKGQVYANPGKLNILGSEPYKISYENCLFDVGVFPVSSLTEITNCDFLVKSYPLFGPYPTINGARFFYKPSGYIWSDEGTLRDVEFFGWLDSGNTVLFYQRLLWSTDPITLMIIDCESDGIRENAQITQWKLWSNEEQRTTDQILKWGYSMNITIKDKSGVLSGATVKLYDKDGNLVFEETTDMNGDITEQDVIIRENNMDDPSGSSSGGMQLYPWKADNHNFETMYHPFTLIIEKAGYSTYRDENFQLLEPYEGEIALQESLYLGAGTEAILSEGSSLDADISSGSGLTAVIE